MGRVRTYFYYCAPVKRKDSREDDKRYSDFQKFITKLKRLKRFHVELGRLQLIDGHFKQKMVDVLMSLDIIDICYNKQTKEIIIVAGDSDFIPVIKRIKKYGTIVHLFYHPKAVHNKLLDEVDELHGIDFELINFCLISKKDF